MTVQPAPTAVIPGQRGLFAGLRNLQHIQADMLSVYVDAHHQYGDIANIPAGPINQVLITRPEHIQHVLKSNAENYIKGIGFSGLKASLGDALFTTDNMPLWRKQRRIMAPPFTPRGVTRFDDRMLAATTAMLDRWQTPARTGEPIDFHTEMLRLTMDIISRTIFNIALNESTLAIANDFAYVLEFAGTRGRNVLAPPLWLPLPTNQRFKRSLNNLHSYMERILAERLTHPTKDPDLISLLINATDFETGEKMDEKQMRDEILTLFFAGHETTAQALTWTAYLLAENPAWTERLTAQVDSTLNGRLPTAADVPALPAVTMTALEALRLYPPIYIFIRQAVGADQLGPYPIAPSTLIILSQWITHRHPEFWPDPERFDPERFTPENDAQRHPFAFFPFGGGPRICLGNSFAILEMELVLTMILQRYQFTLVPGTQVVPDRASTLRPKGGLPVRLTARD